MTFPLSNCIFEPGPYGVGLSESVAFTESGCEALTSGEARELAVR